MTSRDFVYWLQGFFELSDDRTITEHQIDCIKKHLSLVFVHEIDPSAGDPKQQAILNAIHSSNSPGGDGTKYRC